MQAFVPFGGKVLGLRPGFDLTELLLDDRAAYENWQPIPDPTSGWELAQGGPVRHVYRSRSLASGGDCKASSSTSTFSTTFSSSS